MSYDEIDDDVEAVLRESAEVDIEEDLKRARQAGYRAAYERMKQVAARRLACIQMQKAIIDQLRLELGAKTREHYDLGEQRQWLAGQVLQRVDRIAEHLGLPPADTAPKNA